ncbi:MAG: hypothetical protein FWD24_03350 [Treponema sp.]|nr:hypothetical protein [Treponema sp.]
MIKKFIFSVILVCILEFCFGFASCSASNSSLAGIWEAIDENKGTIDIEFFDNGTVKWGDYGTFPYTLENNQILITGKNRTMKLDYKISGNNLFISIEGDLYWDVYKRKNFRDSSNGHKK